jgi:sterol 14-demethylase
MRETHRGSIGGHGRPKAPPRVSGALPAGGHMAEFGANPTAFLMRAWRECGELAEFDLQGQPTVLMTGPEASEAFCRAPDEQLSQSEAYEFMTPIFGEGVIFDAPLHKKDQQLAIQTMALRHQNMKSYARVISEEVRRFSDAWGDRGEFDVVPTMTELTLYTSTHCLLGTEFRRTMTAEFAQLYGDLEAGLHAQAYVDPHADLPVLRRRDAARVRLQEMVGDIVERRRAAGRDYEDALATFMTATYDDGSRLSLNELTGLIIATMFAGHHTSSGTAARVLIELIRHPELARPVIEELNAILGPEGDMTHEALREIPRLEAFVREALRLHPPLMALFRKVLYDFEYKDYVIAAGKSVCLSPYVSHRVPEVYPDPERFDPARPLHDNVFTDLAFGGGRHRCAGSAFALLQLKSVFGTLLRRFDFELVDAPERYVDDPGSMTLRPKSPALVRHRRRRP